MIKNKQLFDVAQWVVIAGLVFFLVEGGAALKVLLTITAGLSLSLSQRLAVQAELVKVADSEWVRVSALTGRLEEALTDVCDKVERLELLCAEEGR